MFDAQLIHGLEVSAQRAQFLACCGSQRWADAMVAAGPYSSWDALLLAAQQADESLSESDWLEAFAAHPRLGARKKQEGQFQKWSGQEQSQILAGAQELLDNLAVQNQLYEQRFGFIFLLCATGKSPREVLQSLQDRLPNERAVELKNAIREQKLITRLRLEKWLCPKE